ncbi:high potential iron-sulfur protein [Burkholderia aenigmatica]|uniref:High-potential iron-sulfur protein n=1 Tax=Burkholderia aenigmatica TaxID=2015348 RepID=A0A6P2Q2N8_9BURK|nr:MULTISPECIES: high-potential iron-sulfur protein [Burkholderia]MDN7519604.1 high-potential iron-sulfur protein [Burkholderia sp. AU45251]VWC14104.1 high potential iron-sulfur protein [Burkholderia aenigmatica]HDR9486753.1 high-potential iron-sulfur protein [Burkholderia aenigmatica]HDR9518543.1 high-potential iron-sulfur protein [Burkholderia aenigmatica]HDR9595410.1 high-potential iron-sulfur protein [Burkholderia aenigmatica]
MPRLPASRRTFMIAAAGLLSAAALPRAASAAPALLDETDPAAKALGYRTDAAHVNRAAFARYTPGQDCGRCSLYQGKAADPAAPCPLFAGKRVANGGWCNAYNPRT